MLVVRDVVQVMGLIVSSAAISGVAGIVNITDGQAHPIR